MQGREMADDAGLPVGNVASHNLNNHEDEADDESPEQTLLYLHVFHTCQADGSGGMLDRSLQTTSRWPWLRPLMGMQTWTQKGIQKFRINMILTAAGKLSGMLAGGAAASSAVMALNEP